MDFSRLEAQVFIGVAVILGCAFVALLCDYLKGVNERLRERSLELTVRLEESERWRQQAMQVAAGPSQVEAFIPPEMKDDISKLHQEVERMSSTLQHEVERMSMNIASIAHLQKALAEREPVAENPVVFEPRREPAPPESAPPAPEAATLAPVPFANEPTPVPETAPEEAVPPLQPAAPAHLAAYPAPADGLAVIKPEVSPALASILRVPERQTPAASLQELLVNVAPPPPAPEPAAAPPAAASSAEPDYYEPVRPNAMKIRVVRNELQRPDTRHDFDMQLESLEPVPAPAAPAPVAPAPEPALAWSVSSPTATITVEEPRAQEPLVELPPPVPQQAVAPQAAEPAPAEPAPSPAAESTGRNEMSLPSGMHDRATLDFLLADPSPFTGLVVAIGLNDYPQLRESAGAEAAEDLLRNVNQLVKSITSNLSGPQHFAARAADDEFVVVFNGEIGPAAQRRMAAVSERLWDFQLRSIGTYSVVFSWGATEANEERFADAIDAATERMRETRQNRKSMGGDKTRKRVVA